MCISILFKLEFNIELSLIGACHNIVELDAKKHAAAEKVALNFRVKKISLALMGDDVLQEIHKFPFPIQKMLGQEALAVNDRLEKGKAPPNLTTAECHCRFFLRYLLPCRHIFHEHMFGRKKLLTALTWRSFQLMFEESGFEVYEHRELVCISENGPTEEEQDIERLRVRVGEINERLRDTYFGILERRGIKETAQFLGRVEATIEPLLEL